MSYRQNKIDEDEIQINRARHIIRETYLEYKDAGESDSKSFVGRRVLFISSVIDKPIKTNNLLTRLQVRMRQGRRGEMDIVSLLKFSARE